MAVGADGELIGSIGGGVMEVKLVDESREYLASKVKTRGPEGGLAPALSDRETKIKEQVHRKGAANSSGMICSGKQTVIFKLLGPDDLNHVHAAVRSITSNERHFLTITDRELDVRPPEGGTPNSETPDFEFEKFSDTDFIYRERLGPKNELYIIGGGHCALALSDLMSKMDFRISIFDDRPDLNTLQKNEFADEIIIVDSYDRISEHIPSSSSAYVVVMTLGYKSDAVVIRSLMNKDFKYFGVLGSKAKMATLMKELKSEGLPAETLDKIHTPIGLPINSQTPEEIAISIAAEIISIKNS
jgi:xanthine dehydrogenase accessory factor